MQDVSDYIIEAIEIMKICFGNPTFDIKILNEKMIIGPSGYNGVDIEIDGIKTFLDENNSKKMLESILIARDFVFKNIRRK